MPLKAPSFSELHPSSQHASRTKKSNRAKGTLPEVLLVRELRRCGLKFKRHVPDLPGKPDVVFESEKVVVFCDGDFWHGRNWKVRRRRLKAGSNATYWTSKLRYNIMRDRAQTRMLERAGWKVIRLWETDLKREPEKAVATIRRAVGGPKGKQMDKLTAESKVRPVAANSKRRRNPS